MTKRNTPHLIRIKFGHIDERLFVPGLKVGEIAERLHRSKQTVSTQKLSAMRKLGIQRDADLIRYGLESNLIPHAAETLTERSAPPSSGN